MHHSKDATGQLTRRLSADDAFRKSYGEAKAKVDLAFAIAEARRMTPLTQREAADLAQVTQAYLSKLESGSANPTIGRIGRLLATWGCALVLSPGRLAPEPEYADTSRVGASEVNFRHTSMYSIPETIPEQFEKPIEIQGQDSKYTWMSVSTGRS